MKKAFKDYMECLQLPISKEVQDEVVDITDQLIDEFERQIPKQSITSVVATTTDESDKDSAPIERDTDNENSSEDTDSSDESNDDDDDEFYVVGPSIYCL